MTILLAALLFYLTPTIVAFKRNHPNRWVILVINSVFGGTGLGWLGSLIWAFGAVHKSEDGSNGGESGLNLFANDTQTVRIENPDKTNDLSAPQSSELDRLHQLKALLDDGAISLEGYAALKRSILNRYVQEP